jgi:hypothetical protein
MLAPVQVSDRTHPTFSQATVYCWYIGSLQGSGVPVQVDPSHVHPGDDSEQFRSGNWEPFEVSAAAHDAVPTQE